MKLIPYVWGTIDTPANSMLQTKVPCLISLLLLVVLPVASFAQIFHVSGTVVDSKSHEPLAFVNIVIEGSHAGGTTDIDGHFRLHDSRKITNLRLSYVGYESLMYPVGTKTENLVIFLKRKQIELTEVEILPGENPAHRIMRNVIDNRDLNDPEKLSSFSYTSYDKTVFSIDADSTLKLSAADTTTRGNHSLVTVNINSPADSLRSDSLVNDSSLQAIEKLISQQYLFMMENVTKRKFMAPDKNYNEVIATKMSGFKDPIFVFLTTQIQSFSFYKPFITIFQTSYVNPVGTGSLSKYFFKIEDTTYTGKDTVFILSFRPKKGTNFMGLKGVISINTRKWAIQNVIAEPAGDNSGLSIRIQQMYELIDDTWWFPVQLNTDLFLKNIQIGPYMAVGSGRYYIRDIVLNPDLVKKEFNHLDIEVDQEATDRSREYWNQYRTDSLSSREERTYRVIDSLGQENNFDNLAKTFKTLMEGQIPWGPVAIDLDKFLGYNPYEGWIAGLGLHTSTKFSRRLRFGGYYRYAFAISESKYGGDAGFLINRRNDVRIAGYYFNDLTESGSVRFFDDHITIIGGEYRQLLLRILDKTESAGLSFGFRTRKYLLANVFLNWSHKRTENAALATDIGNVTLLDDDFIFTEAGLGLKWAYGEKFMQTPENKVSLGTRYPTVWLQYTRGLSDVLGGEFDYNRLDLKIEKTFPIKFLGKSTLRLNAGYIDRSIPACNLFDGHGSYREFTVFSPFSFATMRMNEFLSNGYAALYLYHDFEDLLIKGRKWFHPEFAIAQNIGFGFLEHPEHYSFFRPDGPREMSLGYYESGLLINNIMKISFLEIGGGVFYRWGPYSFPAAHDNFAYKISLFIPLINQ